LGVLANACHARQPRVIHFVAPPAHYARSADPLIAVSALRLTAAEPRRGKRLGLIARSWVKILTASQPSPSDRPAP